MRNLFIKAVSFSRTRSVKFRDACFMAFLALSFSALPDPAHAQSLGSMMCSISTNIIPFQSLFVGIAYIAGAITIGSGLLHLVRHHDMYDRAQERGLHKPIAHLVAGAAMLALPGFIGWSVRSLFGNSFSLDYSNGLAACTPIVGAGGIGGEVGLDGLMMNLIMNIKGPMVFMLSVISILTGIFLIFRGLVKASKYGTDPRTHSVSNILANIIFGTILYTVGTSLGSIMTTVFGDAGIANDSVVMAAIANDFSGNTQPFQNGVYAALTFFQIIGLIAFIRGWLILKDAAEGHGQKTTPQGLTHILGGVLAINIYRFLEVMDTTFGTGFLN